MGHTGLGGVGDEGGGAGGGGASVGRGGTSATGAGGGAGGRTPLGLGGAAGVAGAVGAAGIGGSAAGAPAGGSAGGLGAPGGGGGSANLPGGVAWEPWPTVPAVADGVCQVALFRGGDASSAPGPAQIEIREFDAATGIMTLRDAPSGDLPASVAYAVFTADGLPVGGCNVSVGPGGCVELVRDAEGNVTTRDDPPYAAVNLSLSLLDASRFGTQPHGPVEWQYTLTYDGDTLATATRVGCCGAPALAFTEDSQHRCSDVLWKQVDDIGNIPVGTTERDHWTWDGTRLLSRVTTDGADPSTILSEVTYTYAADGTLAATVVDGAGRLAQPGSALRKHDGAADYVVRTVALPDGSRWIESLDFHYYLPDANVVRDGKVTAAGRKRWNHSPGCRNVLPARRTRTRCQFEPIGNQLDGGWDDPYTPPLLP